MTTPSIISQKPEYWRFAGLKPPPPHPPPARATGAVVISSTDAISEKELGYAGIVEERKVSGEEMIFVEKCKNPKAVSLIIRGGTEHVRQPRTGSGY